jgi:hypothetical protein
MTMTKHANEMATLNITYNGLSADYPAPIEYGLSDRDIRRLAVEVIRAGEVPGLWIANLADHTFDRFVVDRFNTPQGGRRIYLRPRVPFGAR